MRYVVAAVALSFLWAVVMTATVYDQRDRLELVEQQAQICIDVLRTHEVLK